MTSPDVRLIDVDRRLIDLPSREPGQRSRQVDKLYDTFSVRTNTHRDPGGSMNIRGTSTVLGIAALTGLTLCATPAQAAAPGKNAYSTLYYVQPDRVAHATFHHFGEWLYACDDDRDGRTVSAELYWNGRTHVITDENGAASGCGEENLKITDGTAVKLRVCASGVVGIPRKCDVWHRGRA
jgi:hypothetical protein